MKLSTIGRGCKQRSSVGGADFGAALLGVRFEDEIDEVTD